MFRLVKGWALVKVAVAQCAVGAVEVGGGRWVAALMWKRGAAGQVGIVYPVELGIVVDLTGPHPNTTE